MNEKVNVIAGQPQEDAATLSPSRLHQFMKEIDTPVCGLIRNDTIFHRISKIILSNRCRIRIWQFHHHTTGVSYTAPREGQ